MANTESFLWRVESLNDNICIRNPDSSKQPLESSQAYASFGDDGTTVSVSAYGHIMQISRYFGYDSSGFFCVEPDFYLPPYFVRARMKNFMEASNDPTKGLRLNIIEWEDCLVSLSRPSLGFMYDRWPRFTYRRKKCKESNQSSSEASIFALSIQYFCYQGTVFQKYLIRTGKEGIPEGKMSLKKLSISPGICIRNLDFVKDDIFNRSWEDLETFVVSNSNLAIIQKIPQNILTKQNSEDQKNLPVAAALIITPFIDDEPATIDDEKCITIQDIAAEQSQLEITVAYRLQLLSEDSMSLLKSTEVAKAAKNCNASKADEAATTDEEIVPIEEEAMQTEKVAEKEAILTKKGFANIYTNDAKTSKKEMENVFHEDSSFRKICFSNDPSLDFVFRRNLEHILSVCCIPVNLPTIGAPTKFDTASTQPDDVAQSPEKAIVITCGDISGHRVGPRASLSTIQFLSSALTYLDLDADDRRNLRYKYIYLNIGTGNKSASAKDPSERLKAQDEANEQVSANEQKRVSCYVKEVRSRILQVLQGHVSWICTKAQPLKSGVFSPHYWPTGQSINDKSSEDDLCWLPPPSLIDTPLQLLKVSYCLDLHRNKNGKEESGLEHGRVKDLISRKEQIICELRSKINSWISELHKSNKRGTYAFLAGEENGAKPKYRLTDHAMICLALEFVENLKVPKEKEFSSYYSYEEVRRKTLKRFTTENPISKQRTLATSRWPDETRFLLHSKDTFLFCAANMNFFEKFRKGPMTSEKYGEKRRFDELVDPWSYADDRWTKLLDSQAYHDEFQHLDWSKPLWYALVLILVCKGRRVNNVSAEALIEPIRTVLLSMSSYNGLFPGLLGQNRVPTVYKNEIDRDDYWHATFEIPNILWDVGDTGNTSPALKNLPISSPKTHNATGNPSGTKEATRIGQQVEKRVPFSTFSTSLDQMGQTVLSDDWLQNSPAALDFTVESHSKLNHTSEDNNPREYGSESRLERTLDLLPDRQSPDVAGVVVDVPRYSIGTEIFKAQLRSKNMLDILRKKRTVFDSKKRIIWLPHGDKTAVRNCFKACSGIEKENVQSFLTRHINFEEYFLDSATAALNTWETELHMSFFRIWNLEDHINDLGNPGKPSRNSYHLNNSSYLSQTSMSFRFVGDFFDRHWTCYFLEHRPKTNANEANETLALRLQPSEESGIREFFYLDNKHDEFDVEARREKKKKNSCTTPWQQRKVLELLIYNKMLSDLHQNTNEILELVKVLALRSDKGKDGDNPFTNALEEAKQLQKLGARDDYFSIAKMFREYIQILLVIEENLTDNIERIKEWNRREEDRQSQKPRWTYRDQQNHFTTILRLTILSQRQAGKIERLKRNIQSFRESLPSQLESIRGDINFRGSQNVNLFTYVTVVFLPLGFATGLLSMNGVPSHSMLMKFVTLALGALGTTLFVLLNAEAGKVFITQIVIGYRFLCKLLWYTLFHTVVAPSISFFMQHGKRQEQRNVSQEKQSQREQQTPWHERWKQTYQNIMAFSLQEAVTSEIEKQKQAPLEGRKSKEFHEASHRKRESDLEEGSSGDPNSGRSA